MKCRHCEKTIKIEGEIGYCNYCSTENYKFLQNKNLSINDTAELFAKIIKDKIKEKEIFYIYHYENKFKKIINVSKIFNIDISGILSENGVVIHFKKISNAISKNNYSNNIINKENFSYCITMKDKDFDWMLLHQNLTIRDILKYSKHITSLDKAIPEKLYINSVKIIENTSINTIEKNIYKIKTFLNT